MDWLNMDLKIFGLDDSEMAVLQALDIPRSVQEISVMSGYSRTGINYVLKKLVSRKLVHIERHGKKKLYTAASPADIASDIHEAADAISAANRKGVRLKATGKGEFIIHVGTKEIIPAYERIAAENKNDRIRAIQHHRSWKQLLKKIPPPKLVEFNKAIIKNHLILDGILNESAYAEYREEIKSDPDLNKAAVESLGERMADYTIFPDKYFDYDAEIWIFKDTTLIINWHQEIATEIRNKDITGFLRDMFDLMKNSGRKIDHNKLIKEMRDQLLPRHKDSKLLQN